MQPGAYFRISLDLTGQMLGVDRQRAAARKLCDARGWPQPTEYVDNSVGAFRPRGAATEYARLLADAKAGRIDAVVVWDLDRLTRTPTEVEEWITVCEATGLRLVTTDGEIDTATENGRLFLRIKGAVARHEVEHKAARQRAAHAQRAQRGLPPSGPRALGWERDGATIIPAEADAVRAACAAVLGGASLRSVARTWNEAGLTTTPKRPRGSAPATEKVGQAWRATSVRGVLANPRIAGLRARRVGRDRWDIFAVGTWPALVPEHTWRAVADLLADGARRTTDLTTRRYLMSGLAVCGVDGCGAPIASGGRSRPRVRTYRCSVSNHLCRAAEPVDRYVVGLVLARLAQGDAEDLVVDSARPDLDEVRERLRALRADRDGLARLLVERVLTEPGVRAESARLATQIDRLETQLAGAGRIHVLDALVHSPDLDATWAGMDVDTRRAVINALMVRVELLPTGRGARTFDHRTVQYVWRA